MQDSTLEYSKQNVKESTQKEMNQKKEETSNEVNQKNLDEQANVGGEQTTAPNVAETEPNEALEEEVA